VERLARLCSEFALSAPQWDDGNSISLVHAYLWFIFFVYIPAKFPTADDIDVVPVSKLLFVSLVPHMLRDLVDNHHWHLVQGKYRLAGVGTAIDPHPISNMPNFVFIMNRTALHYMDQHAECGLERKLFGLCHTTISTSQDPVVSVAIFQCASHVAKFISGHSVLEIHHAYPNQETLRAWFAVFPEV
jgi:hypothetical protein